MPRFSKTSREILGTCHPDLQVLFLHVVKTFDCSVITGHRKKSVQNELFEIGRTQLKYPKSKHNSDPSMAVDVAPYPINWDDINRFYYFAGYVKGIANELNFNIRWGGDWDNDTQIKDQTFIDLPHYELRSK